jgi:hypothetical protein
MDSAINLRDGKNTQVPHLRSHNRRIRMNAHSGAATPDKQRLLRAAAEVLPSPLTLEVLARSAAVGITHDTWRSGPVEGWHTAGRITDGQMMRISSLTSWEVEGHIAEWCAGLGLEAAGTIDQLDDVDGQEFYFLAAQLLAWITDRTRVLANYKMLAEIADDGELGQLFTHAEGVFEQMIDEADDHGGTTFPLLSAAMRGARMKWWGTPSWPARVDTFLAAIDDRTHPHWGDGLHRFPEVRPEPAEDRPKLRELLLDTPWDLSDDAAQWAVRHGLNYVVAGSA